MSSPAAAERVLLEPARKHIVPVGELSRQDLEEKERRYVMKPADLKPRIY
jgi:hypothetical protein